MKIAIIYPPFNHAENQPNIKSVSDNYGVYPNLSLAYVAAILEKDGHTVKFIDANAFGMKKEEVASAVKCFKPDIMAFTICTYIIHQNLSWIKYLKEQTGVPVIVGGVHMSYYPRETFSHKEIDYAVVGEAENSLPIFIDSLEKGRELSKVDSIVFREGGKKDGKIIITGNTKITENIDSVPFPARHLLPNDKYYEFISQRKNFTGMVTSRGCPFRCIYCEQGSLKFRPRSAKNVADEFEQCYNDYGVKEIDVFDSSFTVQKKRVMDVCDEIISRKIDVEWAVRSRVDLVNREMLEKLWQAGCTRIYYGIESGDENILKTLRKCTNLNQIKDAIKATNNAGIRSFGYFMIGSPGETPETINKTISFAKELDLDYAQFSKVSPLPGTELYQMLIGETKEDYWSIYVQDENNAKILSRPNVNMPEEEIKRYVKKAYRSFYFRPAYIKKAVSRLRSFEELVRSARAAKDMLFFKDKD